MSMTAGGWRLSAAISATVEVAIRDGGDDYSPVDNRPLADVARIPLHRVGSSAPATAVSAGALHQDKTSLGGGH